MDMKLVRRFMAACACAAAVAAAGCDNSANRNTSSTTPPAGDVSASKDQPVAITGCLMRGDGRNDFILTKANEPVGTSGAPAEAGTVERKKMEAAARSYRLDGENDQLEKLVGHQIRVSGTLEDTGDLNKAEKSERGTSGEAGKDREIKESDLAKIDVKSVESIADTCDQARTSRGAR
jgi:hypothetical protein